MLQLAAWTQFCFAVCIIRYPAATNVAAAMVNNMKPKSLSNPRWRRVVFKISGAALSGSGSQNIDPKVSACFLYFYA